MKFSDKEKILARQELRKEFDSFVPPAEIDERIFYHYCENKSVDVIIQLIMKEFDAKECYATKCWWYSTSNRDDFKRCQRIGMKFNCLPCSDSCVPDRFKT